MSDRKRRKRDETTAIATSPDTPTRFKAPHLLHTAEDDSPDADWTPKRRTRSSRGLEPATSTLEPLPQSRKVDSVPVSPQKRGSAKQRGQEAPSNLLAGATDPGERYGDLNQDSYFAETFYSLATGEPITIIGVFDGHGKHGEKASEISAKSFNKKLKQKFSQWDSSKPMSNPECDKIINNLFSDVHEEIIAEYQALKTLNWDGHIFHLNSTADNVQFYRSDTCDYVLLQDFGTTAVICIYFPTTRHLVVANCGDSDAVVGRKSTKIAPISTSSSDSGASSVDGEELGFEAHQMTVSHNVASNRVDVERICKSHGKKTKFANGYLSPNHNTYGFHSLAMTRALGHKFLGKYGVIHDPHIAHYHATEDDVVLVVGSDGLWDVVEKNDVLSIATSQPAANACSKLIELALESWKDYTLFSPGAGSSSSASADNTTVVVLHLKTSTNTSDV